MRPKQESTVPPIGSAFEIFVRVRFHEADSLGHVNNAAYLNYLEQAAIDHAEFLGLNVDNLRALGGVFVARRHDITFHRPAFAGDVLRVVTWLDDARGATVARHYRIMRANDAPVEIPTRGTAIVWPDIQPSDDLIVTAETEWVYTSESGRPRRIPSEIVSLFHAARIHDIIES